VTAIDVTPKGAAAPEHIPYEPPRQIRWTSTGLLLAFLAVFPLLFPNPAVTSIAVITMIFLVAAIGWNIFSGYSGYISIGHAAYYGIGQYTVALLALHAKVPAGWDTFGLLPVAGLVSAVAAVPIGFVVLRVRRHTFIILTVAVMFILQLLAFNLVSWTNGSGGLEMSFPTWQGSYFNEPFYYVGLVAAIVACAASWWVRRSKYGLGLLSIRDDEDRARGLGINATRTKLIAYAISAFFVGVAGGLYAPFIGSVYPQFGFDPTFDLAIAVLVFVGGIGTLSGPVIGALLLIPLQQYFYLQFGNANLYLIAYGVLFILILRLLPAGIAPSVTQLWRRALIARRRAAARSPAVPALAGQSPAGQSPAGQSPAGQSPAGQSPAGQSPAGQSPAGGLPGAPPATAAVPHAGGDEVAR
jgi:branched-chain amino acid transport system permease protein